MFSCVGSVRYLYIKRRYKIQRAVYMSSYCNFIDLKAYLSIASSNSKTNYNVNTFIASSPRVCQVHILGFIWFSGSYLQLKWFLHVFG